MKELWLVVISSTKWKLLHPREKEKDGFMSKQANGMEGFV